MKKLSAALLLIAASSALAGATPEQIEFFERKIRPVLAQECYECHSSTTKAKGGLILDSRPGWQEGGQSGELLIPGDPEKSLLIQSIRHTDPDLKMPKAGAKLDESTLKDFETWVKMGAPDPRDKPSPPAEIAGDLAWPSILERRKQWWSFQGIKEVSAPSVKNTAWSSQPIDQFLLNKMEAAELAPAKDADPRTLFRRLNFVLTGLPPTPEETDAFVAAAEKDLQGAINASADRLLASPRFGERWARHWMDWMRYAETHGSEGDPTIPFAWRYRDYLIRAINADIPYPQLVKEHIAGDLLPNPRIDAAKGTNESALGTAQYRLVLHGFTPTDALDEQVTFIDNQIDTITKSFLGVTVSCARCHNHKFDAISQADFYALYGILADCRPATIDLNLPERQKLNIPQMGSVKTALRKNLAEVWLKSADAAAAALKNFKPDPKKNEPAFATWVKFSSLAPEKWGGEWPKLKVEWDENRKRLDAFRSQAVLAKWDFTRGDLKAWRSEGPTMEATAGGEFAIDAQGERVIAGVYPSGVYSHLLSTKHRGVLSSPNFKAQGGKLWVRARGQNKARVRYVVRNYPRTGIIYPKHELNNEQDEWLQWDLNYWSGDTLHLEITTDMDQPIEHSNNERSWFGVSEVFYAKDGNAPPPPLPSAALLAVLPEAKTPATADELLVLYADALRGAIAAWRDGAASDAQAEFLNAFVRQGWLPNKLAELPPETKTLVTEYRRLEAEVPVPTRAPGVLEGFSADHPLFDRGDHKKPAELIPRRFMDAIDAKPYQTNGQSGRLQFAESIIAPNNPLFARVIVNRLWHYVYGKGLVGTPDNFGRLGEVPTHPELLDYIAVDFQKNGGSLKKAIRAMVTARAFRVDSRPSPNVLAKDGANKLRTFYGMARLDAEAIRDSMLALTGKMVSVETGGPGVGGAELKRSIYLKVVRNNLDGFLSAFDYPVPFATRGKRDVTNVPAQSLTMLNAPLVNNWSRDWARRIVNDKRFSTDEQRVQRMYLEAFARAPREAELKDCLAYLASVSADQKPDVAWDSLAQALFNAKEFIYVR